MDIILIKTIVENPLFGMAGFIIGAISLIISFVLYFKSKRDKEPFYGVRSKVLIDGLAGALDGLEVQFRGQTQNRICVTKILFWNEGRNTINRNDFSEVDPLRITLPDGERILDIRVTKSSSESCAASVGAADDLFHPFSKISFDYLDYRDYFIVQIVHTGQETTEFKVRGKIKGAKNISRSMAVEMSAAAALGPGIKFFDPIIITKKILSSRYGIASVYFFFAGFVAWVVKSGTLNLWFLSISVLLGICGIAFLFLMRVAPPIRFE
ncbi:hypothetical protein [Cupriavidus sp. AcVe19-6a]|uniref:hypothetical protein n=1 Tax=Cupriavidus sp. AcVe19-6a TaxID=2821358 RepID=UPI001AE33D2B|nr:hypothetical protein [Cupriavidus sp. AcVe19-6a]MBP0639458.1 hypothetical protein [Cupriavidus sp. AcVe19-6a]